MDQLEVIIFYILGIKFTWDCSKEPYNRVFKESIMINN
jgi:hypothetical protein